MVILMTGFLDLFEMLEHEKEQTKTPQSMNKSSHICFIFQDIKNANIVY